MADLHRDHRSNDERLARLQTQLGQMSGFLQVTLSRVDVAHTTAGGADAAAVRHDRDQITALGRACRRDALGLAWRSPRVSDATAAVLAIQQSLELGRMGSLVASIGEACPAIAFADAAERAHLTDLNAAAQRVTTRVHRILLGGDPRLLAAATMGAEDWPPIADTRPFSPAGRAVAQNYERYLDRAVAVARRARSRPTWFVRQPVDE